MKLVYFNDYRLGVLKGDSVVDVSAAVADIPHTGPGDLMSGLIARFDSYKAKLQAAADAGAGVPLASVSLRAPLPKPGNIVCMAVNYMENGTLKEAAPINAFHKAPGAIIGPGDSMVLPDVPASIFEGEAEMAIVIGKRAKNVAAADAMKQSFFHMKSRETFAPIGPWLVTADEIADPQKLGVRLWVNGTLKQDFNTDDMAHKIARCIEWVSHCHTLEPGDILATGTNHRGLSSFQDGDTVELETEGLGRLSFKVKDDLKRTWARDTRLERAEKGLSATAPQLSGKYAQPQ
jgi:2-keto-4-pentenoate hydratase/2-oxohepta-3-ene-1,7-dioic acid hydratase in catechol pathway